MHPSVLPSISITRLTIDSCIRLDEPRRFAAWLVSSWPSRRWSRPRGGLQPESLTSHDEWTELGLSYGLVDHSVWFAVIRALACICLLATNDRRFRKAVDLASIWFLLNVEQDCEIAARTLSVSLKHSGHLASFSPATRIQTPLPRAACVIALMDSVRLSTAEATSISLSVEITMETVSLAGFNVASIEATYLVDPLAILTHGRVSTGPEFKTDYIMTTSRS